MGKNSKTAYDIKEASNQSLSAGARKHYAENAQASMKSGASPTKMTNSGSFMTRNDSSAIRMCKNSSGSDKGTSSPVRMGAAPRTKKKKASGSAEIRLPGGVKKASTLSKPAVSEDRVKKVTKALTKTSKETRSDKRSERKENRAMAKDGRIAKRVSRLENRKENVRAKGKKAVAAGETGVNSKAKDLKAREMRIKKRIDKQKARTPKK